MTGPKVTVIVAVRDGAATLERCLNSITSQTYPNTELIVLDGDSSDGSVDILKALERSLAFWESAPDRGIYHAWNKGLARATGDWVCFLGADDRFWQPDSLEGLIRRLPLPSPDAPRVVYGRAAVLSHGGDVLRYEGRPWEQARRDLAWSLPIPHPGMLHHRSLFETHGYFDESFLIVGDYELLLRELKTRPALYVPDVVVVAFQHGGQSNSPRMMGQMLQEIARARRKHGLGPSLPSRTRLKMLLTAWSVNVIGERGFCRVADGVRRAQGKPPIWREMCP